MLPSSPAMTASPDRGQAAYVALEKSRPEMQGQPTLVALPVPRPYSDYGRVTKRPDRRVLPPAVGAFIHWLINESGWTVEEDGELTAIRPRHIAILFRRFRNFRHGCHAPLCPSAGGPPHSSRARGRALVPRMRGSHRSSQCARRNRMARRRAQRFCNPPRAFLRSE